MCIYPIYFQIFTEKFIFDVNEEMVKALIEKMPGYFQTKYWLKPFTLKCHDESVSGNLYLSTVSNDGKTEIRLNKNPTKWVFEESLFGKRKMKCVKTGAYLEITPAKEVTMTGQLRQLRASLDNGAFWRASLDKSTGYVALLNERSRGSLSLTVDECGTLFGSGVKEAVWEICIP